MPRSILDVDHVGDFTLQHFVDSGDPFINAFKMTRQEIFFGNTRILNIDIFRDQGASEYSIYWQSLPPYTVFLNEAANLHKKISEKVGVLPESDNFIGHIFLPFESKEEKLTFPFEMFYFADLAQRGMTFLRIDMPYIDVWADLSRSTGQTRREDPEVGLTSFYPFIAEEITAFFLATIHADRKTLYNSGYVKEILSRALKRL